MLTVVDISKKLRGTVPIMPLSPLNKMVVHMSEEGEQ